MPPEPLPTGFDIRTASAADFPALHAALDAVSRERHYLAIFQAPPLHSSIAFYQGLLDGGLPLKVLVRGDEVLGWCDISGLFGDTRVHIGVLGVGCRRGTGADTLTEAFAAFCAQAGLAPQCIAAAASIDLKQNEAGLLAFCQSRGWPVEFFTAEQLRQAPGSFTPSAFVQSVTGVDNVCERAAVLAAGGPLVFHKFARTGVTFALAARPFAPDWRWQHV